MNYGFLTDMIGLELRKAQKAASKKFEMATANKLLSGQITVLALVKHISRETQSTIAMTSGIDKSSLVPILKKIEKIAILFARKPKWAIAPNIVKIILEGEHALSELQVETIKLETAVTSKFGADKTKKLVELLKEFQLVT